MRTKIRCFLSLEKEETWLNQQLKAGWQLIDIVGDGLFYHFQPTQASDEIIQMDYRKFDSEADYQTYLTFMTDTGWQFICGDPKKGSQYFLGSIHQTGTLFSDQASLMERAKRVQKSLWATALTFLPIYFVLFGFNLNTELLLHPAQAFYTPGLWEKPGFKFVFAFCFELPFALVRILGNLIFPLFVLVMGYLLLRTHFAVRHYQQKLSLD